MATYDWPTAFMPSAMAWGNRKAVLQFASPQNGSTQAVELLAERWLVDVELPPGVWANAGLVESFFERLSGGVNRVRFYHRVRPQPQGTMRGTPTVQVSAVRGNSALTIGTAVGATLKAGDLFSAGGQLFKTADDCVANGSGLLVVPLVHRVRGSITSGTAVVWDRPTADFVMLDAGSKLGYAPFVSDAIQLKFEEAY